jgi:hypothetical protein
MKVFLLAGQSNMQGFGLIEGYPVLRDERIFNLATGQAEIAVEPLHHWHEHPYMPEGIGLGLAMPFALEVLKAFPEIHIGFIPSAIGGSSLDEWMPGNPHFERAVGLYERAKQQNPEIELAGILWHQGEADAGSPETAQSYGERFRQMVAGLRDRLQAPEAPVIAGETCRVPEGSVTSYSQWRPVVTAQTQEAIGKLPNAAFVTSEGLTGHDGYTHFDTLSIREFGLRYAKAYLQLGRSTVNAD